MNALRIPKEEQVLKTAEVEVCFLCGRHEDDGSWRQTHNTIRNFLRDLLNEGGYSAVIFSHRACPYCTGEVKMLRPVIGTYL